MGGGFVGGGEGDQIAVGGMGGGFVGGGEGAGAGCCACAATEAGVPVMTYVGYGGSYTTETTYKYVGHGAGEFAYKRPTASFNCVFIGAGIGVLALIIVILCFIFVPTTSTTPVPIGPPGHCLLWGDPHVKTF